MLGPVDKENVGAAHRRGDLPNVYGTRSFSTARLLILLLLQDLALGLLRVRDLGNWFAGVVALVSRLVLITTALESLDEGDGPVVFFLLTLTRLGSGRIIVVRLFGDSLGFLRFGGSLGVGSLRFRSRGGGAILLLGLLVAGLVLGLGLSGLRFFLRLAVFVVAQEIGGTLARLDLSRGLAVKLLVRGGLFRRRCAVILVLLQDRFFRGLLRGFGGFRLGLLGLLRGRVGSGSGSSS